MNYRVMLALTLLLLISQNVCAGLDELIQKNINNADESYKQIVNKQPSRLWIYVRNQQQEESVQKINSWLESIEVGGKKIILRPIQLVKDGPKNSQLYFFFKEDKDEAEQLLIKLQEVLPKLRLKDLSDKYKSFSIDWYKAGYYKLWLAPDANILNP